MIREGGTDVGFAALQRRGGRRGEERRDICAGIVDRFSLLATPVEAEGPAPVFSL